jgi:hypothetical protein
MWNVRKVEQQAKKPLRVRKRLYKLLDSRLTAGVYQLRENVCSLPGLKSQSRSSLSRNARGAHGSIG